MWAAYRCFADEATLRPGGLTLSEEEARHLSAVRRVNAGDEVDVFNGRGQTARGTVLRAGKRDVVLCLGEPVTHPRPDPDITLVIGGLKQSAWDEMLRHAVELGVNRILRVQTDHTVAEVREGKSQAKLARWRERTLQAVKQSANPWLPELEMAASTADAYAALGAETVQFVAALSGEATPPLPLSPAEAASPLALWVGPEGDFSQSELEFLRERGVRFVTLGPRILRAETAALSWIAALRLTAGM